MCVSKARLGSYIATISREKIKNIDTELFATLDLFAHTIAMQFWRDNKNADFKMFLIEK